MSPFYTKLYDRYDNMTFSGVILTRKVAIEEPMRKPAMTSDQ